MIWTSVFVATDEWEAHLVKGLLQSAGILCQIKSRQIPQIPLTVDGLAEIEVQVLPEDLEDSLSLLRQRERDQESSAPASGELAE